MKHYIKFIEYVRKSKGMTISEFCIKAKYRRGAYYRVISGLSSPSTDAFFRMLDALEVDFKYVKREI